MIILKKLNGFQSFVADAAAAVAEVDADSDDSHLGLWPACATNFHGLRHDVACNLIADMSLVTYSTVPWSDEMSDYFHLTELRAMLMMDM